jgi:hypothetical protein
MHRAARTIPAVTRTAHAEIHRAYFFIGFPSFVLFFYHTRLR